MAADQGRGSGLPRLLREAVRQDRVCDRAGRSARDRRDGFCRSHLSNGCFSLTNELPAGFTAIPDTQMGHHASAGSGSTSWIALRCDELSTRFSRPSSTTAPAFTRRRVVDESGGALEVNALGTHHLLDAVRET